MYSTIILKWPKAARGVRSWMKESPWITAAGRKGPRHEQPTLLRNRGVKILPSSSSSAVQPPPRHLFACSLPGEAKSTAEEQPPVRGAGGTAGSYIFSPFTPPLLLRLQQLQYQQSLSVMLPFERRKGIQPPHCACHISRFLLSRWFCTQPRHTITTVTTGHEAVAHSHTHIIGSTDNQQCENLSTNLPIKTESGRALTHRVSPSVPFPCCRCLRGRSDHPLAHPEPPSSAGQEPQPRDIVGADWAVSSPLNCPSSFLRGLCNQGGPADLFAKACRLQSSALFTSAELQVRFLNL